MDYTELNFNLVGTENLHVKTLHSSDGSIDSILSHINPTELILDNYDNGDYDGGE